MVLLVQKFGGGTLTDLTKLVYIARKIQRYKQSGYDIVVVLSAMQGETDRLIELSGMVADKPCQREYDQLLSVGEQTSVCLMVMALQQLGLRASSMNAWQAGIHSDEAHKRACIKTIFTGKIHKLLSQDIIPVVTGFQALSSDSSLTTLGRGGSDTTAVALAAALQADECQIFVDVQGIYTADPKIEPAARLIHRIPIRQLLSYACMGAKVVQKRAVAIAARYKVALRICPTFIEGLGTVVDYSQDTGVHDVEKTEVTAIASVKDYVMLAVSGSQGKPQELVDLLCELSKTGLDLEHSIKQVSKECYQLDCLCSLDDYELARPYLDKWSSLDPERSVRVSRDKAKVSLLGFGLARDMDITLSLISLLANAKMDYYYISALDHQLTVLVDVQCLELVVRLLHQHHGLSKVSKPVHDAEMVAV